MPGFIQSVASRRFFKRQRGYSGQITIITKPELRSFWGIPLLQDPWDWYICLHIGDVCGKCR